MRNFFFYFNEIMIKLTSWIVQPLIYLGIIYGLYRLIKYFIRYHAECQDNFTEQQEQKRNNQKKIDNINQELDEIEASLNAVSSSDKVTPIWGGQPKKKP